MSVNERFDQQTVPMIILIVPLLPCATTGSVLNELNLYLDVLETGTSPPRLAAV